MESIRRSKSPRVVRKNLWCFHFSSIWGLLSLLSVVVFLAPVVTVSFADTAAPEPFAPAEEKIASEINRLISQVDPVGTETIESPVETEAPPVVIAPPSKHFRPLYRRLHGSPGLRVEWINDPISPAAPPAIKSDVPEYQAFAMAGNSRAMTLLGLMYHRGAGGLKQDYGLAYEWYMKAKDKDDGDAINNLGVLYRDGLGVKKEPKIAYLIFLSVYKWEIGSREAQERAALNIQRLVETLPKPEIHEALSYTWDYVAQVLKSRGTDWEVTSSVLPNGKRPRIRDNSWWSDTERAAMTFDSPAPWDKVQAD